MKKLLSALLIAGLLATTLVGAASAFGDNDDADGALQPLPYYMSITGTVDSIENADAPEGEGYTAINIVDTDGQPAKLFITSDTVYPFDDTYATDDVVTAFYPADVAMITIWPPHYSAAVLVSGAPADTAIQVDRFSLVDDVSAGIVHGYMLGQGGMFAFRTDDNTEIVLANGDDFSEGEIDGRRMVVVYSIATDSIPELAIASKVIVLYEDAVPSPDTGLGDSDPIIDASGWPIAVDGMQISSPAVIQYEDGIIMVPLRAVAQALGYEVHWDNAVKSVRLGSAIHLWIGKTEVTVGRMAPVEISTAPKLINSATYVPLDFFRVALGIPNAYALEGVIEIQSDGEVME